MAPRIAASVRPVSRRSSAYVAPRVKSSTSMVTTFRLSAHDPPSARTNAYGGTRSSSESVYASESGCGQKMLAWKTWVGCDARVWLLHERFHP